MSKPSGVIAMHERLVDVFTSNGLITAFAAVGLLMLVCNLISKHLTRGRIHGSAIAIAAGLVLSYIGGVSTGGEDGLADVALFSGLGLMGGSMLRDFAIVATAFGVDVEELRKAGLNGVIALFVGIIMPFALGGAIAYAFGYTDAVSVTTIGAGAATYIVGPVTGSAIGAGSDLIALSIAIGLVKSISVMIVTPMVARAISLNNPSAALVFGGMMGTTSGVAGGLAATDARLVPYGAMTATFYTGLGCLLGPSVLYLVVRALLGG
ncbi:Malonate transporter protein [Salinisphaera shabanensis E1L3A]|uniref:Malonate transporter protein n=2 Tax=Salinisphaera shabanensis TaxID=180542 RepID=U2EMV8_9GAMM|nr:Malonate transporter protein [Salinisphaera shabanensis E1L3A]